MARLPQPGGDDGNWGEILNDFLSTSLASDGTIKTSAVSLNKNDIGLGNVDNTSDANKPISAATQAALDTKQASGSYVTSSDLTSGLSTKADSSALTSGLAGKVNTSSVGAANGVASLDSNTKLPESQLPSRLGSTELATTITSVSGAAAVDTSTALGAALRESYGVSARSFGIVGDGSDETTKMQAFIDYIAVNGKVGLLPARDIRISAPLLIPSERGWKLLGQGPYRGTNIIQITDNVPIIKAGSGGSNAFRDWGVEGICFTYLNAQPSTNTNAINWLWESMGYQFYFRNIYFRNGYYGQAYVSGIGGAWGGDWDGIQFGSMSGGWINMSGATNAVPNNRYGRIYGDAATATDFLFKSWRGYNSTVDTIEVINYNVGVGIMAFSTSSSFIIGAFKLEGGTFATSSPNIVQVPAGCFIKFGEFKLLSSNGGLYITPSSGVCTIFSMNSGGSSVSTVDIGFLDITATTLTNGYVASSAVRTSQLFIRRMDKSQWKLFYTGGGTTLNENTIIDQWMNKRLSVNKGDATVAVTPGDTETSIFFETPFTAVRDVQLPADQNDLIGGLAYRVYVGANVVNGTNYMRITIPGVKVVYTKTTSIAEMITVEWRRNVSGAAGWIVTNISSV